MSSPPPVPYQLPLIPDILRLICEQSDKPTLAALASTCKAFEILALDVLWFDLDDFYHLVMCISEPFLVEETRRVHEKDIKHVLHQRLPLVSGAMHRFFTYAKRVRRITFHGTSHEQRRVDISVLQALQIGCLGKILIPNLQNLSWLCSEKDSLLYIPLFLGPSLSEVLFGFCSEISGNTGNTFQKMALLPSLCDNYPLLKKVAFKYDIYLGLDSQSQEDVVQATKLMSSSISKWRGLESLIITCISYDAMREISLLPSLKHFEVLQLCDAYTPSTTGLQKGGFPVLECLKLNVDSTSPDLCISVLKLLDMSPLRTLTLRFREALLIWKRIFETVKKHCDHSSLTEVICLEGLLYVAQPKLAIPEGNMLSYDAIKPLLAFHKLDTLQIRTLRGFFLSDGGATREMAENWKDLKCLAFPLLPGRRPQRTSTIKLLNLLPFAEHCPSLKKLIIVVDASNPPTIDVIGELCGHGVYQTALTEIDFGHSLAKYPLRVAAFLASCFPGLKLIVTTQQKAMVWVDIREALSAFTAVRKQERIVERTKFEKQLLNMSV